MLQTDPGAQAVFPEGFCVTCGRTRSYCPTGFVNLTVPLKYFCTAHIQPAGMGVIAANSCIDRGAFYDSVWTPGRLVMVGLKVSRRETRNMLARSVGERGGNRFLPFPCFRRDPSRTVTGPTTPLSPRELVRPVLCRMPAVCEIRFKVRN